MTSNITDITPRRETLPIGKLHPNTGQLADYGIPKNPRFIRNDKYRALLDSITEDPDMLEVREVAVYDTGNAKTGYVVVGGNMRFRAAKKLGYKEVPCKVYPTDTPADKLRRFILKDNNEFGENDWDELANWNPDEIASAAIDIPNIDFNNGDDGEQDGEENGKDTQGGNAEENSAENDFYHSMYKDCLYPSNNDFDIPNLLLERQAGQLELPLTPWGANSRLRKDVATYHFYVDDYRFEALFKDPIKLLASACKAVVEPNCSLHDQTPIAWGLQLIYKKRWLSRYFQECGINVYADLNVSHKFIEYNKMGIPDGYNAFFTRGLDGWMKSLESDLQIAQEISGKKTPNLIVYGGGKDVQKFCQKHGLLYVTDFINAKKEEA